jgi:hypothetical protein
MKEKIYNYLVAALYGLPSCKHCQHKELDMQRTPCSYCRDWSMYELNSKDAAHLERMARYIVKIVEEKE